MTGDFEADFLSCARGDSWLFGQPSYPMRILGRCPDE